MASRLYERLEIGRNATADEIRRAFHKQALKSHPDRLPRGHSATDKANAEEQFRLVSQAYEVLSDPEKRKIYDNYGTYPPPQAPQFAGGANSQRGYQDTRGYRTNGRATQYTFKDPFELFDEVFREMDRSFARDPFFSQSLGRGVGGMDMFSPFMGFNLGRGMLPMPFSTGGSQCSSSSFSYSSSSNNGVQQKSIQRTTDAHGNVMTIESHTDSSGNQHVKKTYPDGHVSYRVNGERQALPGSAPTPPLKQITRPPQSSHPAPPALPPHTTRPSPTPNMAWSTAATDGYNDNPRHGIYRQGSHSYSDYPNNRYDPPAHTRAGHRADVYDPTRYDY
ncbi:DnaJ-domain-containing protein [Cylindrobasidium torrendii FP15055 ss-10]|uniref:DnaJ-domain-containing protein n=1 Tax=Cylindrobasidium torrendii FP15055 ss-10 TaxID=1314674 RepID=A0A0D7BFC9_9AGAR|nr:DnaJ-domain-containing protein [Cylindrobasidium torrendii FP15055 ss-10]